jgi:hypothetical protein
MVAIPVQLAKHFRDVHFGGNWTTTNLKDVLSDISWEQAVKKHEDFNTIAALVYHVNYFVGALLQVLQGGPLDAHDKYSFDVPELKSQEEWKAMVSRVLDEADLAAQLIEKLPEEKLEEDFADKKYGSYHRNILGIIEHTHYHLGQIVILKRMKI